MGFDPDKNKGPSKQMLQTCPVCKSGELVAVSVGEGLITGKLFYSLTDAKPKDPGDIPDPYRAIDVQPLVCNYEPCSMISFRGKHAPPGPEKKLGKKPAKKVKAKSKKKVVKLKKKRLKKGKK